MTCLTKTTISFALAMLISSNGYVLGLDTDYHPFVEEGKTWVVENKTYFVFGIECYTIKGDTIIAEQQCKKLIHERFSTDSDKKETTILGLFEKDKRVYCFPANSSDHLLIYDFEAKPGDVLTLASIDFESSSSQDYTVQENITGEFNNNNFNGLYAIHKKYLNKEYDFPYIWYEGFGSIYSPLFKVSELSAGNPILRECYVGNEVLYEVTEYFDADGDINNDFSYNVGDVSDLYGFLVGPKHELLRFKSMRHHTDLNGDGEVNVGDISALYSVILRQ